MPFRQVGLHAFVVGEQASIVDQNGDSPEASKDGVTHFLHSRRRRDIDSKRMQSIPLVVEASFQSRQALRSYIEGGYQIPFLE